jgi:hypothetical protein
MGYNPILCDLKSLLAIEIPKHDFCFAVFFVMQMFWFSMFWVWILALLQVKDNFLVCMWCAIQGIFMLCVVSVVTTLVIGVDIGAHDKVNPHVCNICPNQLLNSFFKVREV